MYGSVSILYSYQDIATFHICTKHSPNSCRSSHSSKAFLPNLRSLAERLVITNEGVAIAHLVLLDTNDGLLAAFLADRDSLNPGLNVLLGCELKHSNHLGTVAQMAGADVRAVRREHHSIHCRKVIIGKTTVVEATHYFEGAQVGSHIKLLGHVGAWSVLVVARLDDVNDIYLTVEDEVELEGQRLRPILVASVYEVISSELFGVFLFVLCMR